MTPRQSQILAKIADAEYLTGIPYPPRDAPRAHFIQWELATCLHLARRWFVDPAIADTYVELSYLRDPATFAEVKPILEDLLGRPVAFASPEALPAIKPRQLLAEHESKVLRSLNPENLPAWAGGEAKK